MKILAPGRYVGKATCRSDKEVYQCNQSDHFDTDKKHTNVIISYHVPLAGVITLRGHSEEEVDRLAKIKIYEALTAIYVNKAKDIMELEKLVAEVK